MVKVANDPAAVEGELPAVSRHGAAEPRVSGISLRLIAGLAATAHGSVHASAHRLDVSVDSTTPLRAALRDAGAAVPLTHRLVLADAAALSEHGGRLGEVVTVLDRSGAAGL